MALERSSFPCAEVADKVFMRCRWPPAESALNIGAGSLIRFTWLPWYIVEDEHIKKIVANKAGAVWIMFRIFFISLKTKHYSMLVISSWTYQKPRTEWKRMLQGTMFSEKSRAVTLQHILQTLTIVLQYIQHLYNFVYNCLNFIMRLS